MNTNEMYLESLNAFLEMLPYSKNENHKNAKWFYEGSPSYCGENKNIPQCDSDILLLHNNRRIPKSIITPDDVFMPLSETSMECSIAELDLYVSGFAAVVVDPPIALSSTTEKIRDRHEEKITKLLIEMRYAENYVRTRSDYHVELESNLISRSCAMLSSSVFSSLNIIYIDKEIHNGRSSFMSDSLLAVLRDGFIPVGWRGSYIDGKPAVFRDIGN